MESSCRSSAAEVSDGNNVDKIKDKAGNDKEIDNRNVFLCFLHHRPTPTRPEPHQR